MAAEAALLWPPTLTVQTSEAPVPGAAGAPPALFGRFVPDRRLYDGRSHALDIVSVEQRAILDEFTSHNRQSTGPHDLRFRDLTARRNLRPERYADSGNIIAGGALEAAAARAAAQAELDMAGRGRGKARVHGNAQADNDRGGLREPYALRRE